MTYDVQVWEYPSGEFYIVRPGNPAAMSSRGTIEPTSFLSSTPRYVWLDGEGEYSQIPPRGAMICDGVEDAVDEYTDYLKWVKSMSPVVKHRVTRQEV